VKDPKVYGLAVRTDTLPDDGCFLHPSHGLLYSARIGFLFPQLINRFSVSLVLFLVNISFVEMSVVVLKKFRG